MGFIEWFRYNFINCTVPPEEIVQEEVKEKEPVKKKTIYRPDTWETYIGQEKAKSMLQAWMRATKERGITLGHVLIHGHAGTGKTTLARLIANELKVKMTEVITSSLVGWSIFEDMICEGEKVLVFLDEIHGLDRGTSETLYSMMEDFQVNGEDIEPFTLVGATTEIGEIRKNRKPFLDRFKLVIKLEDYTVEEIKKIIKQYKEKMWPDDKITGSVYSRIARNSRNVPRIAIKLLESTVYTKSINQVLFNFGLLQDGFTNEDLEVLEFINKYDRGVSIQNISNFLQTSTSNYKFMTERYLVQNGLVGTTSKGRILTQTGVLKMKALKQTKRRLENAVTKG